MQIKYVFRCKGRSELSQNIIKNFQPCLGKLVIEGGHSLFSNNVLNVPVANALLESKAYRATGQEPLRDETAQQPYLQLLWRTAGPYMPRGSRIPDNIIRIDFLPAAHLAFVELSVSLYQLTFAVVAF